MVSAILRCPAPRTAAISAAPTVSTLSTRRGKAEQSRTTSVRPHPPHLTRRGLEDTVPPPSWRVKRTRANPHGLPLGLSAGASIAIVALGVLAIVAPAPLTARVGDVLGFALVAVRIDGLAGLFLVALGANALAVLLLIVLATHDPSHAVERDYYAKGLAWDAEQAAARAGERLGWKLALAIAPARQWGKRRIDARLVDRDGRALAGARLQLEARHLRPHALRQRGGDALALEQLDAARDAVTAPAHALEPDAAPGQLAHALPDRGARDAQPPCQPLAGAELAVGEQREQLGFLVQVHRGQRPPWRVVGRERAGQSR